MVSARDIVERLLAEEPPVIDSLYGWYCVPCGADGNRGTEDDPDNHADDCVWAMAQRWKRQHVPLSTYVPLPGAIAIPLSQALAGIAGKVTGWPPVVVHAVAQADRDVLKDVVARLDKVIDGWAYVIPIPGCTQMFSGIALEPELYELQAEIHDWRAVRVWVDLVSTPTEQEHRQGYMGPPRMATRVPVSDEKCRPCSVCVRDTSKPGPSHHWIEGTCDPCSVEIPPGEVTSACDRCGGLGVLLECKHCETTMLVPDECTVEYACGVCDVCERLMSEQ